MRLVKVSAPQGKGAEIVKLAFECGISEVTIQVAERQRSGNAPEVREAVDVKVSTAQARQFIDALLAAPFFDRRQHSVEIREPRSILSGTGLREITRPVPAPIIDIDEELWQFTHVTFSFVLRVLVSSLLVSYGMTSDSVLLMLGGLLFLPFTPLVLACGFGMLTRQWKLVGHAVVALIAAIAVIFVGGIAVASFADGPILFDDFPPMIAGVVLSLAVGLAASVATADDVGRRELVGLAAASQVALIPAWFGLSMIYGFDGTALDKAHAFSANLLALVGGAAVVYGGMFALGPRPPAHRT